jgi:2-amino-4-hydroxy-6-hydroxymethyldihydropteridine diphosphokinase
MTLACVNFTQNYLFKIRREKLFYPTFDFMSEHIAYILTGSNLGDRMASLKQAGELIVKKGHTLLSSSPIYETAPWGPVPQPAFLNQVVKISTKMEPDALMQSLLDIENEIGRMRNEKMGPRIIDLDILFYDRIIYQSDILDIPHPRLQDRRFVLQPLADICPEYIHPALNKSINQLLAECPDQLNVTKIR